MGELIRLYDVPKFRERFLDNLESQIGFAIDNHPKVTSLLKIGALVNDVAEDLILTYPHLDQQRAFVAQQVSAIVLTRYNVEQMER